MNRTKKIAVIGTSGYDLNSDEVRITCFPWNKLAEMRNIRDFDRIVLDLLAIHSIDPSLLDQFAALFTPPVAMDILKTGGRIIVLGDPRFDVEVEDGTPPEKVAVPFLRWACLQFAWDGSPGDTVTLCTDHDKRHFKHYLESMRHWQYSLRQCKLNTRLAGELLNMEALSRRGVSLKLEQSSLCENRLGQALAFIVNFYFERKSSGRMGVTERHRVKEFGDIVFLPATDLPEDESIRFVLGKVIGVELSAPVPPWLSAFEAPGQATVDERIKTIRTSIDERRTALSEAEVERAQTRECLRLLYEKGLALEECVRQMLRTLGADVEEPETPGKEDGWVTVKVGDEVLRAVIEVKSTAKDQFNEAGLRQLLDWINRGVELRHQKCKGIFIGANAVDGDPRKRPFPFTDGFIKSATLHSHVAINVVDLYLAYVNDCQGKFDRSRFWKSMFSTAGIFDIAPHIQSVLPGDAIEDADNQAL